MQETIHICYAIYDEKGTYSKLGGTAILSVFENTDSPVRVHLLHDNTLSDENRRKFIKVVRSYGQEIVFYNIENLLPDIFIKLPDNGRFSKAAMYRLLMGELLPENLKRVIYLDTDTLVTADIKEFWNETTGENGLGAISEKDLTHDRMLKKAICTNGYVSEDKYFNSGVLLIDTILFRNNPNLCITGLKLLEEHPDWDCCDQDVLNYLFSEKYRQLPIKYDIFPVAERLDGNFTLQRGIYHYAGLAIDVFNGDDVFNRLWMQYFIKTPWFDEDMLLKIFSLTPLGYNQCKVELRNAFNKLAGRRRVFFGSSNIARIVMTLFAIKADERYIAMDGALNDTFFNALAREINNLAPNEVGVLFYKKYGEIANALSQRGLQEGEHFIDGTIFLTNDETGEEFGGRHIIGVV